MSEIKTQAHEDLEFLVETEEIRYEKDKLITRIGDLKIPPVLQENFFSKAKNIYYLTNTANLNFITSIFKKD